MKQSTYQKRLNDLQESYLSSLRQKLLKEQGSTGFKINERLWLPKGLDARIKQMEIYLRNYLGKNI